MTSQGGQATPEEPENWNKRIQGYLKGGGNVDELSVFLKGRVENEPAEVISNEEIRERLRLIRALQSRLGTFEEADAMAISNIMASFLFQMPLSKLKALVDRDHHHDLDLYIHLGLLETNLNLFSKGYIRLIDRASTTPWKDYYGGECALTGSDDRVQTCLIVPSSMFETEAGQTDLKRAALELFAYFFDIVPLTQLVFDTVLKDEPWNLIRLRNVVRDDLESGSCGFECLGFHPEGLDWIVKLKFHWLGQNDTGNGVDRKIPLGVNAFSDMLAERFPELPQHGHTLVHDGGPGKGTVVRTGTIFRITMPNKEDAVRVKILINMQWVVARITSMASLFPEGWFEALDERLGED